MDKTAANFRFGPYEFRPRTRELYKHGVKIRLRPQPLRVLEVLLEHASEPVSREELRQQLWPADTFVDFEHGLNTAVKELRAVLSDSADQPRYIETLPKLGYRIIVPVDVERAPTSSLEVQSSSPLIETDLDQPATAPVAKSEVASEESGREQPTPNLATVLSPHHANTGRVGPWVTGLGIVLVLA